MTLVSNIVLCLVCSVNKITFFGIFVSKQIKCRTECYELSNFLDLENSKVQEETAQVLILDLLVTSNMIFSKVWFLMFVFYFSLKTYKYATKLNQ